MKYLSVCSGIEAATVAWHHMGWEAVGFSEIEKFPSQLLNHHYPNVTNFGDMTKYKEWKLNDTIGLLVGGTPCQSFSVAGLRKGLEDPRGNLMLTYLGIADHYKPKWILWENVPGVLSSNGGKDFACFLQGLAELGYGFAYRVLDAQHFGVPQRRKRVFVVGCLGDWRGAAQVLFESESLCRDITPSREKGKEVANCIKASPSSYGSYNPAKSEGNAVLVGTLLARDYKGVDNYDHTKMIIDRPVGAIDLKDTSKTLTASYGMGGADLDIKPLVLEPKAYSFDSLASNSMKSKNPHSGCREVEIAKTLDTTTPEPSKNQGGIAILEPILGFNVNARPDEMKFLDDQSNTITVCQRPGVAFALAENTIGRKPENGGNGNGFTEDGPMYTLNATGVHGVAYGFEPGITKREGDPNRFVEELTPTLRANMGDNQTAVAIAVDVYNQSLDGQVSSTVTAATGGSNTSGPKVMEPVVAPTLTTNDPSRSPRATEVTNQVAAVYASSMRVRRLTPKECERLQGFPDNYTNTPTSSDTTRYKALGNSMAVPVMRWIGERINAYSQASS